MTRHTKDAEFLKEVDQIEALNLAVILLDPADDSLWDADGWPKMSAVKKELAPLPNMKPEGFRYMTNGWNREKAIEERTYHKKLAQRVHALGITMDEFLNKRLNAFRLAVKVTGGPDATTDKEIREEADRCLDLWEAREQAAKKESGKPEFYSQYRNIFSDSEKAALRRAKKESGG